MSSGEAAAALEVGLRQRAADFLWICSEKFFKKEETDKSILFCFLLANGSLDVTAFS